jgi:hypothetical protein
MDAITYVGQISENEQKSINISINFLDKIGNSAKKLKLQFSDHLLRFEKNNFKSHLDE